MVIRIPIHLQSTAAAALAAVTIAAAPSSARADAEPGDLDASFGRDGIVRTNFSSRSDPGFRDAALDVAAGGGLLAAAGRSGAGGGNFALALYEPDGSPKSVFGGDGKVVTGFGGNDQANAVAITPGRGLIAAGRTNPDFHPSNDVGGPAGVVGSSFAVSRYFITGDLNSSFGGDGKVTTAFDEGAEAHAVALQDDGKIVVAGATLQGGGADTEFALARYNPDGSLDTTFDGDGKVVTGFGGGDYATSIAIQEDGKIVVAGITVLGDSDFALARYNPDGSLDPTFDGDGKVSTDFSSSRFDTGRAVAIDRRGRIVVAGDSAGDLAFARYKPDGSLDQSFIGDGKVITDSGVARSLAIDDAGRIVAAGSDGGNFLVVRLLPSGHADLSFGHEGRATTAGSDEAGARGLAIDPDGRIVVAGSTAGEGDFRLARYHAEPVDDTAPETDIDAGPAATGNDPRPTFRFSSSEPRSSFTCSLDGVPFAACGSPLTPPPLDDGAHTFRVRATDRAGNTDPSPAVRSFTVDTVAPETTIDSGPASATSDPLPSFAFSSSEPGSSFACSADGTDFVQCESPYRDRVAADGPRTFFVRAEDPAGNRDPTPARRRFTVDTTPPKIVIKGKGLRLRHRHIIVRLRCRSSEASPPCVGHVILGTARPLRFRGRRQSVRLAGRHYSLGAGERRRVRLTLPKRKASLLRAKRKARRLRATARVHDAVGNRGAARRRLRLGLRAAGQ